MLTTGKVAAALGVHPDTIRNYEKRGLIPAARRSPINGYRVWTPEDLQVIREVLGCQKDPKEMALSDPATNVQAEADAPGPITGDASVDRALNALASVLLEIARTPDATVPEDSEGVSATEDPAPAAHHSDKQIG